MLPILHALLPPPPPPLAELARSEPRYFPTCAACQEDAVQGQEWARFGAQGGCGHGMHPHCWMLYVTHSAQGPRHGASAQGHLYVQCPTCRRAVAGERTLEHAPRGRYVHDAEREQFERLALLGSEPGDPPVYIPRVPRIAFPEHVNVDDGRLGGPAQSGGQGRGTPRVSSRSNAPTTPTPTRPPAPGR